MHNLDCILFRCNFFLCKWRISLHWFDAVLRLAKGRRCGQQNYFPSAVMVSVRQANHTKAHMPKTKLFNWSTEFLNPVMFLDSANQCVMYSRQFDFVQLYVTFAGHMKQQGTMDPHLSWMWRPKPLFLE